MSQQYNNNNSSSIAREKVLRALYRLVDNKLPVEGLLNEITRERTELRSDLLREDILAFCLQYLRDPSIVPQNLQIAMRAIAYSVIEDASAPCKFEYLEPFHRAPLTAKNSELEINGLRYLIVSYWRKDRFAEARAAFELMAARQSQQPSRRGAWHLCIVATIICNDERQHTLARRFAMQALGYAWELEESALIQRAQYDYANSLSLSQTDESASDGFAELRSLVEGGKASLDHLTNLSVLIGSSRDFMRRQQVKEAEYTLAQVEERSDELNLSCWYLFLAEQVRLAHFKDQTLIRDSKLEEIHRLQKTYPNRLGERARSHVCFHLAGQSESYRAMDGGMHLFASALSDNFSAIVNCCRNTVKHTEQLLLAQA